MLNNPTYLMLLCLFNCAILLNYNLVVWEGVIPSLAVFFTILTLVNPRFWWANIVNVGLSLLVLVRHFPRMANHCNIEVIIELIILGLLVRKTVFPKFRLSSSLIQQIIRISLITVYFFTGFHKLNTDFFNPCVSCVNGINEKIFMNFTGNQIKLSAIWSCFFQFCTIFIEMVLPFGLLHFMTRKWTAIILLGFHCWLSFVYYADFSGLASFLIIASMIDFDDLKINSKLWNALKVYIFFTLFAVIVNSVCVKQGFLMDEKYFVQGLIFNIGWFVFMFVFFKNYVETRVYFDFKNLPILFLTVLIISLWTLKTYIGLGNSGNLTMFSNLLTEKNRSNHLIFDTKNTKFFEFEEDNILVLKIHDSLKKDSIVGYRIPLIEFKYQTKGWVKRYPSTELSATIVYKNDTINIQDLKKSEYNNAKWWYKYINFRKIQTEGSNRCYW